MNETIVIGLSGSVVVLGLGCLGLAYFALRRVTHDKEWVREIVGNIQVAYIEGYGDGKEGKPPTQPGTAYAAPSASAEPPPIAEADEQTEIGING